MENKRTILIAGGSEGIGYATAEKCLSQNCRVILIARGLPKLESARERLLGKGHSAENIEIVSADLQKSEEIPALVERLPWVAEGLWGLVLNAAIERIQAAVQFSCEHALYTTCCAASSCINKALQAKPTERSFHCGTLK